MFLCRFLWPSRLSHRIPAPAPGPRAIISQPACRMTGTGAPSAQPQAPYSPARAAGRPWWQFRTTSCCSSGAWGLLTSGWTMPGCSTCAREHLIKKSRIWGAGYGLCAGLLVSQAWLWWPRWQFRTTFCCCSGTLGPVTQRLEDAWLKDVCTCVVALQYRSSQVMRHHVEGCMSLPADACSTCSGSNPLLLQASALQCLREHCAWLPDVLCLS